MGAGGNFHCRGSWDSTPTVIKGYKKENYIEIKYRFDIFICGERGIIRNTRCTLFGMRNAVWPRRSFISFLWPFLLSFLLIQTDLIQHPDPPASFSVGDCSPKHEALSPGGSGQTPSPLVTTIPDITHCLSLWPPASRRLTSLQGRDFCLFVPDSTPSTQLTFSTCWMNEWMCPDAQMCAM